MTDLKFNLNGFTRPTTRAECAELLREMGSIVDSLQSEWDSIGAALATPSHDLALAE